MKKPFLQFAVTDHLGDLNLRACHPFARAVWMDLVCIMSQGEPYGHLRVEPPKPAPARRRATRAGAPGGVPGATPGGAARAIPRGVDPPLPTGAPGGVLQDRYSVPPNGSLEHLIHQQLGYTSEEMKWAIAHLEEHGVPSRTDQGILFSRRMVRDEARHQEKVRKAREAYLKRMRSQARHPKKSRPGQEPATPDGTPDGAPGGLAGGVPGGTPDPVATGRGRGGANGPAGGVARGGAYNQNQNYMDKPTPTPPTGRGNTRAERNDNRALELLRNARKTADADTES